MKLVAFKKICKKEICLGYFLENSVYNLNEISKELGFVILPKDIISFLKMGDEASKTANLIQSTLEANHNLSSRFSIPINEVILLPPVSQPEKIICLGPNYLEHAIEGGNSIPEEPILFGKFANAIIGPESYIKIPTISSKVDFEAELGVVIGRMASNIKEAEAPNYIAGYLNFNDISSRDLQFVDTQWMKGKFLDTYAPIGPWLVTPDEVGDPNLLDIKLRVNGEIMQSSNTSNMIFPVYFTIAFISKFVTLKPGDIIATGTPPGVGFARKPPVYLKGGDIVEVEIEKLGILRNTCQIK